VVTSLFVVDETVTLLQRRANHAVALAFAERALEQRFLPVLDVPDRVLARALDLFKRSQGLDFSFTDCTSFALMSEEQIEVALAFDEDFRRAGFRTI
ncbi:MAG: PIN domain-containing protein, partial [Candidatus Wallbacteria bacterium]|nr:PIN domain-containing protein [Candidatus Wallbacteria bacterium]